MPVRPLPISVARRTRCASPAESVAGWPVEREVAEPGVAKVRAGGRRHRGGGRPSPRAASRRPRRRLAGRRRTRGSRSTVSAEQLGDVPAGDAHRERLGLEPRAAARGARHRVHQRFERGAAAVGVLALVLLRRRSRRARSTSSGTGGRPRARRAGSASRRPARGRPCRAAPRPARGRRASATARRSRCRAPCPAARSVATYWPSGSP